jgi:hypothetical protein
MEFLFRNRSPGKRQIKPSQDIALLEDTLALEESDDSEYKLEDDDEDNDNASASSSDGSAASDDDGDSEEEKNADLAEERDDLNLSELLDKYEKEKKVANGVDGLLNAKHLSEFKVTRILKAFLYAPHNFNSYSGLRRVPWPVQLRRERDRGVRRMRHRRARGLLRRHRVRVGRLHRVVGLHRALVLRAL